MILKKMEIAGFKSFSEKSAIEFPPGISAIVGPNGCGKSNIVDALRWAMGEQSVKQLRGKSMEDVIFAGASGHAPLNMAEVSLTLANENGSGPEEFKDFTEIMLTRRLYRSGESAYLMNKQPCRLKDILNLFYGSGMGPKSYAVIQQGNIGAITEAGPEERRYFIEEAAGITRYKNRKQETLRKLEATTQNLLRLKDIIGEVERQMTQLHREALKAERYRKYQKKIKKIDLRLAFHQYETCSRQIRKNELLLKELLDEDLGYAARLQKLDAAIEAVKLRRMQKEQAVADKKNEKYELQRKIDRSENDLDHLRKEIHRLENECGELTSVHGELEARQEAMTLEMAGMETRRRDLSGQIDAVNAELASEYQASRKVQEGITALNAVLDTEKSRLMRAVTEEAAFKNTYQTAVSNKDHLARRRKRVDEEAAILRKKLEDMARAETAAGEGIRSMRADIETLKEGIEDLRRILNEEGRNLAARVKAVQQLEYERGHIRSRYAALKKMEENFEWCKDGVKALMKQRTEGDGIVGMVADILVPEPEYRTAVEAVLGEALQYVLVDTPRSGLKAIAFLQAHQQGRCGFVPMAFSETGAGDSPSERPHDPRRLLSHIAVPEGGERAADALLGRVYVADDLSDVLNRKTDAMESEEIFVTKKGDVLLGRGVLTGGSPDKLSGILSKKQELRDLADAIVAMDQKIMAAREDQRQSETRMKALEKDLHARTEERIQADEEAVEAEKELIKLTEALKHERRSFEMLQAEQDHLSGEADDLEEKVDTYKDLMAAMAGDVHAAQAAVAEITEKISVIAGEVQAFQRREMALKLKQTALTAEAENAGQSLRRLTEFRKDGQKRLEQLARDLLAKHRRRDEAREKIAGMASGLSLLYERFKAVSADLEVQQADVSEIDRQLGESGESVHRFQSQREEASRKIRLKEVEQAQAGIRREAVLQRVMERYHQPLNELMPGIAPEAEESAMTPEEMEGELVRLRGKVDRIGHVNLGAIEAYEEHRKRHEFLIAQQEDLLKAIDDLHKVIRKINQVSQEKFVETFNQINGKLSEVFPKLFGGGAATLVMTEPGKPLETGVEFMAHPPGKKLTRMSLLSGGEKAMAAIAFLFSIFLIKPASFCLLDEIDAPLDESNVYRFNELLRDIGEKSQIIMITHKKKSMEFADTLFGITMEQKGISKIVSVNLNGDRG